MKFKSKVDLWIDPLFIALGVATVWFFCFIHLTLLVSIVIVIFAYGVGILPIRFNTYCIITDFSLVVHFGYIKKEIAISDIVSLQKTHNSDKDSGYSLSLDRIEIVYNFKGSENMLLISPKNKEKFLSELYYKNVLIKML